MLLEASTKYLNANEGKRKVPAPTGRRHDHDTRFAASRPASGPDSTRSAPRTALRRRAGARQLAGLRGSTGDRGSRHPGVRTAAATRRGRPADRALPGGSALAGVPHRGAAVRERLHRGAERVPSGDPSAAAGRPARLLEHHRSVDPAGGAGAHGAAARTGREPDRSRRRASAGGPAPDAGVRAAAGDRRGGRRGGARRRLVGHGRPAGTPPGPLVVHSAPGGVSRCQTPSDGRCAMAALVLLARTAGAGRVPGGSAADRLAGRRLAGGARYRRTRPARGRLAAAVPAQAQSRCLLLLHDHAAAGTAGAVDRRGGVLKGPGQPRAAQPLGGDLHMRLVRQRHRRTGVRGGFRRALLHLDLQVEQEADRLLLDALQHLAEHVEALALVLHQRVALRIGAQADALLEVVHLVEVLAPLAVDDREQDLALQFADRLCAEFLLAPVVRAVGVLQQLSGEELGLQRLGSARLVDDVLDRHADRVQLLEAGPELLQVPVLGVPLGGGTRGVRPDHVIDHVPYLVVQVLAVQYPLALGVDDGALLVQHLVVLQDVLADLGVLRLDLGLGVLDLAGHHLGLDGHVLGDVEPLHDHLDRARPDPAHQLVLQRQVEARLAGVALPAGPAAQLVVDAAGLVPFGAQHVQPTGRDDLLGLLLAELLLPFHGLVPRRLVLLGFRFEAALAQFGRG